MRKIFLLLSLGLVALTGCKKDSTSSLVENPVLPPATETFAPGVSVTIKGSGFTDADEIWFRFVTKAATDEVKATITKQTATEITFIVPQVSAGEHAVVLKRGAQEMALGKITVAAATTAATKLYGYGHTDDSDSYILWEIDKTTGELSEIVQLPDHSEDEEWLSPIVDPANGNIYLYKSIDGDDVFDLYRINPGNKMLEKIGRLKEGGYCSLCMIDNQLHALIEKENYTESNYETFYSLVSIDPTTAETTLVADFGSLHQALNIPLSVSAGLDGIERFLYYDVATKSLIVPVFKDVEDDCWQLTRFDIVNQKIIPGVGSSDNYISLFVKDSKACGAFYNDDINTVDFRLIDTENLTIGESLGSASTGSTNKFFGEIWAYDGYYG